VRASAPVTSLLLCLALSLIAAGCVTYTNHSQSCSTSQVFGDVEKMTCSGTAGTVRGEGSLTFGDPDDREFRGNYRLEVTASVEQGRMDIYTGTESGRKGGEVSPGNPLKIEATGPAMGGVTLKVKGGEDAEVRGLEYEATVVRMG
jgi:hypothetical protein